MTSVRQTVQTIRRQAERLGCEVEVEEAATGTHYLTLDHPAWCDCDDDECGADHTRVIRVGDHEANEARYQFRVNRRPDLDVDVGYQVAAVRRLAEWLNIEPDAVPYLRRAATIEARQQTDAVRIQAERDAETAERRARYESAVARLSPESRATNELYETMHGPRRKRFRRTARYRALCAELDRLMAE